jgi:hypothetical protein
VAGPFQLELRSSITRKCEPGRNGHNRPPSIPNETATHFPDGEDEHEKRHVLATWKWHEADPER